MCWVDAQTGEIVNRRFGRDELVGFLSISTPDLAHLALPPFLNAPPVAARARVGDCLRAHSTSSPNP